MNRDTPSDDTKRPNPERPRAPQVTPSTDMQPEDAGTPASGAGDSGRGTAAGSAMKQEHKTSAEPGSRG